jgi:hypothetical protein
MDPKEKAFRSAKIGTDLVPIISDGSHCSARV